MIIFTILLILCIVISITLTIYYGSSSINKKYKCSNNKCIEDPNGTYTTNDCDNNCNAQYIKYKCSNNKCIEDPNGTYTTNDCDSKCNAQYIKYKCSDNKCIADPNGTYTTSDCDSKCNPSNTKKYKCSDNKCIADPNGTYTTNDCNNICNSPCKNIKLLSLDILKGNEFFLLSYTGLFSPELGVHYIIDGDKEFFDEWVIKRNDNNSFNVIQEGGVTYTNLKPSPSDPYTFKSDEVHNNTSLYLRLASCYQAKV